MKPFSKIINHQFFFCQKLKEDVVKKTLPRPNIRIFDTEWNSKGISPSAIPEHAEYINNLCKEVEYLLKDKITDFIHRKVKDEVSDPQYDEVVEHLRFCQNKCSTFYGRNEILDQCGAYLKVINKLSSFKVGTSKSDSILQMLSAHFFMAKPLRHVFSMSQVINSFPRVFSWVH